MITLFSKSFHGREVYKPAVHLTERISTDKLFRQSMIHLYMMSVQQVLYNLQSF